ncbi:MAG: cobalamin-binding protein [Actinomycetota bacterium]|nr:cobalamin-binding protein [Actinomycetota bacterium]
MRVVSLVPSATEIIAALGLADQLVGRSHECNYPPEVAAAPVVSASRVDTAELSSAEIDRAVRDALADGRPLYAVDAELLERLAPDLIVTQDLCEVCAVSSGEVKRVSHIDVQTLSLDPRDLSEIEESIRTVARHLHAAATGEFLAQAMHHRIDTVHQLVRGLPRQRVFVAEWLDPPFAAGHWVPEMVDLAGGDEVLGLPRERSYATTWEAVAEAAPQLVVLAPCGFDLERTVSEAGSVPPLAARVVAVDGDAAYSRPGPRVAEGVAQLAHLLHPDDVEAPALPSRELSQH